MACKFINKPYEDKFFFGESIPFILLLKVKKTKITKHEYNKLRLDPVY